ncbi:hypothetical protein ACLOJK_032509 [Asimina triloba]
MGLLGSSRSALVIGAWPSGCKNLNSRRQQKISDMIPLSPSDMTEISLMDKKGSNSQEAEVRKGPWTMEEDLILINYIANHGEGVWNSLARSAGLKRTGKSCRLRWLNYLRPDVRRGNITPEEQLLIMELHSRWGNSGWAENKILANGEKTVRCEAASHALLRTMQFFALPCISIQLA